MVKNYWDSYILKEKKQRESNNKDFIFNDY